MESAVSIRTERPSALWTALALIEAPVAAYALARLLIGHPADSPNLLSWFAWVAAAALAYLGLVQWPVWSFLRMGGRAGRGLLRSGIAFSLPFLLGFLFLGALPQFTPAFHLMVGSWLSPIQPFPTLALGIALLAVLLLKTLAVSVLGDPKVTPGTVIYTRAADVALPIAMILIGLLQASVYLTPIGNAFLRFWAIADGVGSGVSYPLTITEAGPVSAGSPPYVYDLPMFPLMLKAAFVALGHNSAAAHLPAFLANVLFPLALYLLIREATGSRITAVIFTALASIFPYLRLYVLNLPDPDALLLTSACFAAYFYLRALSDPYQSWKWLVAGIAAGVLSLARPEGILYAGCIALGLMLSRPRLRQLGLFVLALGLFVVPMVAVWWTNFGFLWPQNYNRTLRLNYPLENLGILQGSDALGFYHRGLGTDATGGMVLLVLFAALVLFGTLAMLFKDRPLLAMVVPGIGNTVLIFFANPYIPNTYQFADFFRHASFGIPFLVLASAYGFHQLFRLTDQRRGWRVAASLAVLLLLAAIAREGDIMANPTATHRPGPPYTQVLTSTTHLSIQTILEHPMPLPPMTYHQESGVTVAYPTTIRWPDAVFSFYEPFDMSFDSAARPFGYGSVVVVLVALAFGVLARERSMEEAYVTWRVGAAKKVAERG